MKKPMQFSMSENHIKIDEWLDHNNEVDDVQRQVTNIEVRPDEGNVYIHWEEA